jgi:hypothetical protein
MCGAYRLLSMFFLILLVTSAFVFPAGATEYTYVGPNNGDWGSPTNWSPPGVPSGDLNSAWINANPGTNVNVYLYGGLALNGLKVDAGDSLTFGAGLIYSLSGTNPYVINNGSITLSPNNSYFQLNAGVTATFMGTGTVNMVTGSSFKGATTALYINDLDHTIRGAGWIDANMENRGLIVADGPELHIHGQSNNHQVSQTATGVLTTAGPGSLLTMGNGFNLSGGQVNPNGGEVRIDAASVFNGTNFGP